MQTPPEKAPVVESCPTVIRQHVEFWVGFDLGKVETLTYGDLAYRQMSCRDGCQTQLLNVKDNDHPLYKLLITDRFYLKSHR